MKPFQLLLLAGILRRSGAFFGSTAQRGIQNDVSLRQHSWHDSDFYNSQNDATRRPLHDEGEDSAAYTLENQEKFSASIYKRNEAARTVANQAPTSVAPLAANIVPPVGHVASTVSTAPFPPNTVSIGYAATASPLPPNMVVPVAPAAPSAEIPTTSQATTSQSDEIGKRLESLEENVKEIKDTLNYIAALLEKSHQ